MTSETSQVSCEIPINLSSVLESDSCQTSLHLLLTKNIRYYVLLIWEIEPSLHSLTSFRQLVGRQKPSLHIFSLAKVAAAMMEEPKSGARKSCCSEFEGTHLGLAGCLVPRAPGNMIHLMMNVCLILQSKSKGFFAKSQFSRVYKLFGWTQFVSDMGMIIGKVIKKWSVFMQHCNMHKEHRARFREKPFEIIHGNLRGYLQCSPPQEIRSY